MVDGDDVLVLQGIASDAFLLDVPKKESSALKLHNTAAIVSSDLFYDPNFKTVARPEGLAGP